MSSFEIKENVVKYEQWFEKNPDIFNAELKLIKDFLPKGKGIEIGVGTGLFASKLGVKTGVEPSKAMAFIAQKRGLKTINAHAEKLPIPQNSFNFALLITVFCFLKNPLKALSEIARILKKDSFLLIALLNKESPLVKQYSNKKKQSSFYNNAHFYCVEDVINILERCGFSSHLIYQTLYLKNNQLQTQYKEGYNEGSFVLIKSRKRI